MTNMIKRSQVIIWYYYDVTYKLVIAEATLYSGYMCEIQDTDGKVVR